MSRNLRAAADVCPSSAPPRLGSCRRVGARVPKDPARASYGGGWIVDLMEFQAKELFARHGVPVSVGTVVTEPEDAEAAAVAEGGRVVVKAQVKTGGRGKA